MASKKSKSQSKKDLFAEAAKAEVEESLAMSDFVKDRIKEPIDKNINPQAEVQESVSSKKDEEQNDSIVYEDNNKVEVESDDSLSSESFIWETHKVESSNDKESDNKQNKSTKSRKRRQKMKKDVIENRTSFGLDAIAEEDARTNKVKLLVLFSILLFICAGTFLFFYVKPAQATVLLFSGPIEGRDIKASEKGEVMFKLGEPIYIYFQNGDSIGLNQIDIKIEEVLSQANDKTTYLAIGQTRNAGIKPEWTSIKTYFQPEYFEHGGRYRILFLKVDGSVIAEQGFQVVP